MNFTLDATAIIVGTFPLLASVLGSYISLRLIVARIEVKVDTLWSRENNRKEKEN